MRCKWEQQVVEAARKGSLTSSLRAHCEDCPQCAQTEWLAASLQGAAAGRSPELPPAGMIWRRAQARQRERLQQRAIRRPFAIAGALAGVYSLVLLFWAVSLLPAAAYRRFAFSPQQGGGVMIAGALLSVMVAIAGSLMFLTENRR